MQKRYFSLLFLVVLIPVITVYAMAPGTTFDQFCNNMSQSASINAGDFICDADIFQMKDNISQINVDINALKSQDHEVYQTYTAESTVEIHSSQATSTGYFTVKNPIWDSIINIKLIPIHTLTTANNGTVSVIYDSYWPSNVVSVEYGVTDFDGIVYSCDVNLIDDSMCEILGVPFPLTYGTLRGYVNVTSVPLDEVESQKIRLRGLVKAMLG